MSVKLLPKHDLELRSLKGGSSKSTLVKIPHCWKSHVAAQLGNLPPESISASSVSNILICSLAARRCNGDVTLTTVSCENENVILYCTGLLSKCPFSVKLH